MEYAIKPTIRVTEEAKIELIKNYLEGYHSSDIAKELIQNADDAKATHIYFIIFKGYHCKNSNEHIIIDKPSLAVYNDGLFKKKDFDAIPNIIGGSKKSDTAQIGRFGLGLKSVYNICNLFYYFGYNNSSPMMGAILNPWSHINSKEPYISYNDEEKLKKGLDRIDKRFKNFELIPNKDRFEASIDNGFGLWLPLTSGGNGSFRKDITHLDYEQLKKDVFFNIPFEIYLAQCAHLKSITLYESESLESPVEKIFSYTKNCEKVLWRTDNNHIERKGDFKGIIKHATKNSQQEWRYQGIQVFEPDNIKLAEVMHNDNWPKFLEEDKYSPVKAQNHTALTIIYPENYNKSLNNSFLWASFLPIEEKFSNSLDSWKVIFHGYFLLTSDRKKLLGLPEVNSSIEAIWNNSLAKELLMPLLPEFICTLNSKFRNEIIKKLSNEESFKDFHEPICSKNIYAHILDVTGVSWRCLPRKEFDTQKKYSITLPSEFYEDFVRVLKQSNASELYILSSSEEHLVSHEDTIPYAPARAIENILNLLLTKYTAAYSEHNLKFIETLWRQSESEYNVWGNWIIQLIKKGYFTKASDSKHLTEIIKKYFPEERRRFCTVKLNNAVRELCNDGIMTPELIYIPTDVDFHISNSVNNANAIKKQIEYLIAQQKNTLAINELIDLMRRDMQAAGGNTHSIFFNKKCILVDECKSDGPENKRLISYEELGNFKTQHRIFLTPYDSQKIPWLKNELAVVLDEPVYMVSKEKEVAEISAETLAASILENKIIQHFKNHKIIRRLHKDSTPINENCREAIRKLLCGRNAKGFEMIILPDNKEYSFVENMQQDFPGKIIFLQAENCKHLTPALTAQLGIKSFDKDKDDFLSTLLEILLNSHHSEKHAKDIYTCLGDLNNLSASLKSILLKKAWIPNCHGIPLEKILTKDDFSKEITQLSFFAEMGWHIFEEEKISEYIPAKHKYMLFEVVSQLKRFKDCCEKFFKGKNSFSLFNNNFNFEKDYIETFIENCNLNIESLKLLKILKDYKKNFDEFANIIPKIPSTSRELEILNYFSDVDKLKHVKVRKFYIEYMTSCLLNNPLLLKSNVSLLLPTQNNDWRQANRILLTDRIRGGNHHQLLSKDLWKKWVEDDIVTQLEQNYTNEESHTQFLKQSFSKEAIRVFFKNYIKYQAPRISLFITLLYSRESRVTPIEELALEIFPFKSWKSELEGKNPSIYLPDSPITIELRLLDSIDTNVKSELAFSGDKILIDNKEKNINSFFITQPRFIAKHNTPHWKIILNTNEDGTAPNLKDEDFNDRLYQTIVEWVELNILNRPNHSQKFKDILKYLDTLWENLSYTQTSVENTCNVLKDRLPQILDVIKLSTKSELRGLRLDYDKAIQNNNISERAKLQSQLWNKAKNDEQVGDALRNKVRENGYSNSSVLFELLQNANDAIIQAKELHGYNEQQYEVPKSLVKIRYHKSSHTLDFLHDGRAINYYEKDFSPEWRFDLQNMLNFNVSYKNPQDNAQQTIGMFGLGFKSVHLISKEPQIYSKNLHFKIVNSLFPESLPKDSHTDNGVSTYFKLPLMDEVRAEEIFSKLSHVYKLIPVLCQGIESLEVEADTDNIKSYSVTYTPEIIYETETFAWKLCNNCNVLVFEAKLNYRGNEKLFSVAFCIERRNNDIYIKNFENTPFLWNTMPTQEEWQCKYVINGFFKLNPGRTHVDIQDEETLQSIEQLGEQLGKGLCSLYKERRNTWSIRFWADLWNILSVGLNNTANSAHARFLQTLHCSNKGLSYWSARENFAASGLPQPFRATTSLVANPICIHKNHISNGLKKIIELAHDTNFIDYAKKELLETLSIHTKNFIYYTYEKELYDALLEIICKNNLSADIFYKIFLAHEDWPQSQKKSNLFVKTLSGKYIPIQQVLVSKIHINTKEYDDEFLRAKLAPAENILANEYVKNEKHMEFFITLRGRSEIGASKLTEWCLNAGNEKRMDVLTYILHGKLNAEIREKLERYEPKNSWIFDFEQVKELAQEEYYKVLLQLFPKKYEEKRVENEDEQFSSSQDSLPEYLQCIDITEVERQVGTQKFKERCWPTEFSDSNLLEKLAENDTEAWCTLLLLGCLQSMGRPKESQHKAFIEKLRSDDIPILWSEFTKDKGYKNSAKWTESLDAWFDKQTHSQEYSEWMRYFTSMYQINKYVKQYRELFINLPATIKQHGRINIEENFSIRVNPDYTFAGKRWDAPPLPLKIGKFWIIRELSRLGFEGYRDAGILPYCWIPKEDTLKTFGVHYESSDNHLEKHRKLVERLEELNKIPHFNYNFDLALREI